MTPSAVRSACVAVAIAAIAASAAAQSPLSENFDSVTPPALPDGWTAASPVGAEAWITDTSDPDTAPNDAHLHSLSNQADERLDSPPIAILTAGAQLSFRHRFSFAVGPCGGAREGGGGRGSIPEGCEVIPTSGSLLISVGGGEFQDILAAGGSFVTGGYNSPGNTWIRNSVSYESAVVNLPPGAAGTTVVLRWRLVTEFNPIFFGSGDWWLDSIQVCDGFSCDAVPLPWRLSVVDGANGVWEPGETVEVDPEYLNNGSSSIHPLGTAVNLIGPGVGADYSIDDGAADYGDAAAGGLASCASTGNCYSVRENSGIRQAPHWDAQLYESLDAGIAVTWALHIGGSFDDVPASNPFYAYVETVLHRGVTGGCGEADYCPAAAAVRKQMAVFLLKSKYGSAYAPPPASGIFADVPASDPFAPWIESLYALGITGGCGTSPLAYCPDQAVLRRQMAVFLLKTRYGSDYVPAPCQGIFTDVACPSPFADWIEQLYALQVAAGCGGNAFCPDNPNTRGQMAAFLTKTFALTLYGP